LDPDPSDLDLDVFGPPFPHRWAAQWEKPPWDAELGIELGPALQQADTLPPSKLRRTLLTEILLPPLIRRDERHILYIKFHHTNIVHYYFWASDRKLLLSLPVCPLESRMFRIYANP
jgi:hypothetical protein